MSLHPKRIRTNKTRKTQQTTALVSVRRENLSPAVLRENPAMASQPDAESPRPALSPARSAAVEDPAVKMAETFPKSVKRGCELEAIR